MSVLYIKHNPGVSNNYDGPARQYAHHSHPKDETVIHQAHIQTGNGRVCILNYNIDFGQCVEPERFPFNVHNDS